MRRLFSLSLLAALAGVVSASPPQDAASPGIASGKGDYISWVDPRIESARGRWFFSTPAARPFGMVKLTPHTVNRGQGGGGYNASVHTALGFCHLHGWMTTGLEMMPTTGGDFSVTEGEAGWKSAFDPKTEIVKPGYHKLFLEKYATWVELTTTRRVGLHRYTYTQDGQADIILNVGGVTYRQTKELADSIQFEATLRDGLDNEHRAEHRFRVIESPVNHAPQAKVTVSSEFNRNYAASLAVDGITGIHMGHEWTQRIWQNCEICKPVNRAELGTTKSHRTRPQLTKH